MYSIKTERGKTSSLVVINVKVLKLQIELFFASFRKSDGNEERNLMVKKYGCIVVATCKSNEKSITEAVIKWHVCILRKFR